MSSIAPSLLQGPLRGGKQPRGQGNRPHFRGRGIGAQRGEVPADTRHSCVWEPAMGAGLGLPSSGWAWVSGLGVLAGDAGPGTCRAREGEGVEVTASGQAVTGLRGGGREQDHPGGSLGRWAARAPKANSTAGDHIPPALPGQLLNTGCTQQAPQALKHPHTGAKTLPSTWEDLATCHVRSWCAERCPTGLSVPNTGSAHTTVG